VGVGKRRNFDHFLNPVVMILKNEQEVTVHSPTFFWFRKQMMAVISFFYGDG
jgi:hypothetical protein